MPDYQDLKVGEFRVGSAIQGYFLVKVFEIKNASNGSKFANITLTDDTGQVNAKMWDFKEDQHPGLKAGEVVKLRGEVTDFQGVLQVRVDRIRPVNSEDDVDVDRIVPSAPFASRQMLRTLEGYVGQMADTDIRAVVFAMLERHQEKLLFYPAAKKNHHSIKGGLLYHITTMLQVAEKLLSVYSYLNSDLLYAGVILHDIGKLEEMDANPYGIVADYSLEGHLLGHIVQAIKALEVVAERLGTPETTRVLLQHMVLSHHMQPDYGSPKPPMLPEAELLHFIDNIDARMYDIRGLMDATPAGSFSEKVWTLENRMFYRWK